MNDNKNGIAMAIVLFLVFFGLCIASWGIVCGIIKLIDVIFGLTFSWEFATFVWVVVLFVRWVLSEETSNDHRRDYD